MEIEICSSKTRDTTPSTTISGLARKSRRAYKALQGNANPHGWPGDNARFPMASLYLFYKNLQNVETFPTNQQAWNPIFQADFDYVKSQVTVYLSFIGGIDHNELLAYVTAHPHATMTEFRARFKWNWSNRSKSKAELAELREAQGRGGLHSPLKQKTRN